MPDKDFWGVEGFDKPKNNEKTPEDLIELGRVALAAKTSVQSFPPDTQGGVWIGSTTRQDLLPPFATRECDDALRRLYRNNYNTLIQGAFTGLIKKVTSAPYVIKGPNDQVSYFNELLQNSQYGKGWKFLVSQVLMNYLTQNLGSFIEVIGSGDPNEPLTGQVLGLASLDSARCWITGQPEFPIIYQSPITGQLHQMHKTRVLQFVDMPDGQETLYGYGMCAMYRCAAIADREIKMGKYIAAQLDEKPSPGIMLMRGIGETKLAELLGNYKKKQGTDSFDEFAKTLWITSLNQDIPIEVQNINFSVPPEKFSFRDFTDIDVNELALALGVDKQELWELTGGSLGSGQQSILLSQKSRGKALGDILVMIERALNLYVLPESCEFKFDLPDDAQDSTRADIDTKYMQIAAQMLAMPTVFSPEEVREYLATNSRTFRDTMSASKDATAIDTDQDTLTDEMLEPLPEPSMDDSGEDVIGDDSNNESSSLEKQETGDEPVELESLYRGKNPSADAVKKGEDSLDRLIAQLKKKKRKEVSLKAFALLELETDELLTKAFKDIPETSRDYYDSLEILLRRAFAGAKDRSTFGAEGRASIESYFKQSFLDGLKDAGSPVDSYDMIDEEDDLIIATEIKKERSFWNQLANEMFKKVLPIREVARDYDKRANAAVTTEIKDKYRDVANAQFAKFRLARDAMFARINTWVNKGLMRIYELGKLAAKGNQNMAWRLGPTEHCETCFSASLQVHRARDWAKYGLIPKSNILICGGYNCQCNFEPTNESTRGKFSDIPVK